MKKIMTFGLLLLVSFTNLNTVSTQNIENNLSAEEVLITHPIFNSESYSPSQIKQILEANIDFTSLQKELQDNNLEEDPEILSKVNQLAILAYNQLKKNNTLSRPAPSLNLKNVLDGSQGYATTKNFISGNQFLFQDQNQLISSQDNLQISAKSTLNQYFITTKEESDLNSLSSNDILDTFLLSNTKSFEYILAKNSLYNISDNYAFTSGAYKTTKSIGLMTKNLGLEDILQQNLVLVVVEVLNLAAPNFVNINEDALNRIVRECEIDFVKTGSSFFTPQWISNLTKGFNCIFTLNNLDVILCSNPAQSNLADCFDLNDILIEIIDLLTGFISIGEGLIAAGVVSNFISSYIQESKQNYNTANFNYESKGRLLLATAKYGYNWQTQQWDTKNTSNYSELTCTDLNATYPDLTTYNNCTKLSQLSENEVFYAAYIEFVATNPGTVTNIEYSNINNLDSVYNSVKWSKVVFTYCTIANQNPCQNYVDWFFFKNESLIDYTNQNCFAPDYCLEKKGLNI